jgi:hypothetical protein
LRIWCGDQLFDVAAFDDKYSYDVDDVSEGPGRWYGSEDLLMSMRKVSE